ncbi:MAG: maleylacetoacetate isomerase [Myxococcales bacterium]|nr:maleylacetoacetate isomerase [Myxococcales bacterium]
MKLYESVQSSASFRVRIALNLKGFAYESVVLDLRARQHLTDEYGRVNPLRSVPAIEERGMQLFESMAICEWLEETRPEPPLLPFAPAERGRVRAMAQLVACDVHPLNNLRVLRYLSHELHADDAARDAWQAHWIREGFIALETMIPEMADFCHGRSPTLADVFLVPQVVNAGRVKLDLSPFPRIQRVYDACMKLPAFDKAHPKNHPAAAT